MDDKPRDNVEIDINDAFDKITFSEEKICNEAFEEGRLKGIKDGKIEGYHLGFHKGVEFGLEIGFYKELVKALLSNPEFIRTKNSEKMQRLTLKLNMLLENVLKDNIEEIDFSKELSNIRSCYSQINSLFKLNVSFGKSSPKSF